MIAHELIACPTLSRGMHIHTYIRTDEEDAPHRPGKGVPLRGPDSQGAQEPGRKRGHGARIRGLPLHPRHLHGRGECAHALATTVSNLVLQQTSLSCLG